MTSRRELIDLQDKARRAGRTVTFARDTSDGPILGVFYLDPLSPGPAFRAGKWIAPLSFAETERTRPAWWELIQTSAQH